MFEDNSTGLLFKKALFKYLRPDKIENIFSIYLFNGLGDHPCISVTSTPLFLSEEAVLTRCKGPKVDIIVFIVFILGV